MPLNNEFIVATYNIQFGNNIEQVIKNMIQMARDGVTIFCLQEIINIPDEEHLIDRILKGLGKEWKASYHVGEEYSKLSIGTAIVWNSKLFILDHEEKILLPKLKKFRLHEHFYYRVVGVPSVTLQRKALSCYLRFGKTTVRVTCVHVDNVGGPRHRLKQISHLISELTSKKSVEHEIICGDFNTFDLLKTGLEKKRLQKKLGKDFIDASYKVGWTADIHNIDFRTSIKIFYLFVKKFNVHVRRRLDYIWVKNLEIKTCHKLEIHGSDHFPIIAKLKIPTKL